MPETAYKKQVDDLLEEAYELRVKNLKQSIVLSKKAWEISREAGDKALMGQSLNQLSLYYMIMGEHEKATNAALGAIKHFEELNDEKGIANAKYSIAGVYYKTDNYHLGLTYLIDCLKIYKKHKDYHNESRTEKSLGTIYEYFGDQNNAVRSYENAIEAGKKCGELNLESNAYNNLSGLLLKQGKVELARQIIDKSVAIKRLTGDTRGYAFAIYGRGKVYAKLKNYNEAEQDYKEAMRVHNEMGERLGMGMAYNKLGALYLEMGRLNEAKEVAREGLEFSDRYNIVIIKFKLDYLLYRIYKMENNRGTALEYLEKYLEQKEAVINTQTLKVIENYELIIRMRELENEARLQKEKAEIIEKKNRAEEAARVRQEFLSSMSHEIRTPLNAITTIASMLGDRANQEEKLFLDSLKFASNNLLRIINDILDFTKLDLGKTHLEMGPCAFKVLMENIWGTYESQAKEKGLKMVLKMDKKVAESYELDETRLTQILGNLISNAIKFTEAGFVNIEVKKIEQDEDFDRLLFKVSDSGEGIHPQHLDEIFESFSQPKPVTTRKQGGTGLGLAIVKKLVELYGSRIGVKSEVGKGSEFYFELRLKIANSVLNDKFKVVESSLKGKTALLAEDNDINALLILKLLSQWGISTDHVLNGKEALQRAKEKAFDFILMDIHMPEMNGFECAESIRKQKNLNSATPLFALTADITAQNRTEYIRYFDGFLWKPLQIEKLYEALTRSKEMAGA